MKSTVNPNVYGAFVLIQSLYVLYIIYRIPYTIIFNGKAGLTEAILLFFAVPVAQLVFISILAALEALGKWINNLRIRSVEHQIESLQTQAKPLRDRIRTLSNQKQSVMRKLEQLR